MTYRDHVSTETLADHAEGLLGESDAGRVQVHLDECEDCRAEALLLVSLQDILRADEVGPMPVEYASRIDVALAELAAAEPPVRLHPAPVPILNAPAEAAPAALGGAKVIDLATRRKVMMTGLRRVGTVAAGVVLLIGGAALGVQTLGNHTDLVPPVNHDAIDNARSFATLPTPPKDATAGKNGIKFDKNGWIYLKSGKVLLPDGTVVLPGANKNDPPTVISPKQKTATTAPVAPKTTAAPSKVVGKGGKSQETVTKPKTKPVAPKAPAVAPGDPADPQAPNATAAPVTPAARPDTAKAPNAQVAPSNPDNAQVGTQSTAKTNKDTYVSQSGSEYTEDNFANKVMDLMSQASHDSATPGAYTQTSSGQPQTDPTTAPTTGPTTGPNPSISPSMTPQNLAISYYDYRRFDAAPTAPGRGPADPEVKFRVQRCATQLNTTALAGDEGLWAGKKATIVVTPNPDNANQVIGYVFYGNCAKSSPVTADDAQWQQRVDKPSANPSANSSAPVKRVGGTSPGTAGSRSESLER
jgi:hypothetical protein